MQHVYRFIAVAQRRKFNFWPSVRRELSMLLGILPLLQCRLDAPLFHRAIATDASEYGTGVVTTSITDILQEDFWPLCSSRHHAILQAQLNNENTRCQLFSSEGSASRNSTP